MRENSDQTVALLQRWHAGNPQALHQLLAEHLPRLQEFVHRKLHAELREVPGGMDSLDLVQEAAAKILAYLPRFVPENGAQFQGLLRTFVVNHLRNELRSPGWRAAAIGDYGDSVLELSVASSSTRRPDRAAEKAEERAWMRMALEFLPVEERRFALRVVEDAAWQEIANEFRIVGPDAARMRFQRLLPQLANIVRRLKAGGLGELLGDGDAGQPS